MDLYPSAKYVHLLALFVAAGVTAVTKLAVGRAAARAPSARRSTGTAC